MAKKTTKRPNPTTHIMDVEGCPSIRPERQEPGYTRPDGPRLKTLSVLTIHQADSLLAQVNAAPAGDPGAAAIAAYARIVLVAGVPDTTPGDLPPVTVNTINNLKLAEVDCMLKGRYKTASAMIQRLSAIALPPAATAIQVNAYPVSALPTPQECLEIRDRLRIPLEIDPLAALRRHPAQITDAVEIVPLRASAALSGAVHGDGNPLATATAGVGAKKSSQSGESHD